MKTIKNIIFDLGNVIIDIQPERTSQALKELLNVNYDLFDDEPKKIFYDFETGRIGEGAFVDLLTQLGENKSVRSKEIIEAWNAMLIDVPLKRLEMMKELSNTYRVFILSNTNTTHMQWVKAFLERNYGQSAWTNWGVTKAYYSHELDSRKPEERCFSRTLSDAQIQAEETLFIDDHQLNINEARKLGIQAQHHPAGTEICDHILAYLN